VSSEFVIVGATSLAVRINTYSTPSPSLPLRPNLDQTAGTLYGYQVPFILFL